jgi:hypothetical protein
VGVLCVAVVQCGLGGQIMGGGGGAAVPSMQCCHQVAEI